uniref:Uncharacterized protein n=1 Tax=Arundo donax TaxID=35708 RepID=A0A0A9BGM7_ARUDO
MTTEDPVRKGTLKTQVTKRAL